MHKSPLPRGLLCMGNRYARGPRSSTWRTDAKRRVTLRTVASVAPRLDFGDPRIPCQRARHVDPDSIGEHRRERDGALDEIVAADAAKRDPRGPIPSLHLERGDAVKRERRRIAWLDGTRVIVLQRIDDDVIDRLLAVEVDLHPIGKRAERRVVPSAAGPPACA